MKTLYLTEWEAFIRFHEISGKGRALVYLPGLSIPAVDQFLSVVTHPDMAGYHSFLIDYIGAGFSDKSEVFDYSIENHARTIAAVLDYEGVKCCTIVGHSMGGTVGIMLALLRPDLVSNLIVAEANLSPGGGEATKRIASYSEAEYVNVVHKKFLEELRETEKQGDMRAAFINAAWSKADPAGLYKSSVALVALDPTFKAQFLELPIPRTFIYGAESLPNDRNEAGPDAPDPDELEAFDVQIGIVPNAGHAMMFDNLPGFVKVLKHAIQTSNTGK